MSKSPDSADELEGQLFAAIDLGSNSFHLVVARMDHGHLQVIDRIKDMVRLAEGVDASGLLDPAVEERALDCLTIFGQRIEQISQTRVAAVGTNALRRMKEGWRFLNEAETCLGAGRRIAADESVRGGLELSETGGLSHPLPHNTAR